MKKHKFHIHLLLILAVLVVAAPVLLAIIVSTQSMTEVFSYPPKLTPGTNWQNYPDSWKFVNLGRMMLNSTFLAFAVTLGKLIISLMAAFAFSHFEFRGKNFLFFLILITLMLPIPVRIVPLFELFVKLGKVNQHLGVDTYFSLIVPFIASATGTFLFRQHFLTIPAELTDAAKMDGCGPMRFLFQILIPLSKNTIGALVVIEFVYIWNQYLWPLIVINSEELKVVQLGIRMLIATEALQNWGVMMAGVLMAMIPPLVVFFIMQESFMKGFAFMREK
jgi:sn-glycerol 3-phosphate transport system permease protein